MMAAPKIGYRAGYCVTCQKQFKDRYSHAKKYPNHIIQQHTAQNGAADETLDASDTLDSRANMADAADEQIDKKSAKKISGAEFASQPLFVAALGTGFGWLSASVFGPQNALNQPEAYGIATGALRLIGRYFLKNVNMEELSEASDDIKDVLLIVRSVGDYIARKLQARAQNQQEEMQQAGPSQPRQQPQEQPQPIRQRAATTQNGHVPVEQEAAFVQDQYTTMLFNMPSMGEAA